MNLKSKRKKTTENWKIELMVSQEILHFKPNYLLAVTSGNLNVHEQTKQSE